MRFTNIKNKIFILCFLGILVSPWVLGGLTRLFAGDFYTKVSVVETEKRELTEIDWKNLLNTGESISGFIDDRIPFRYSFISLYKAGVDKLENVYQLGADAIGQKFYKPETKMKSTQVMEEASKTVIGIIKGQEEAEAAARDANYFALRTYQDVIIARDGWLFLYGENEYDCFVGNNILTEEEKAHYADLVNQLYDLCQAKGKELYIYIAPNKSQVYYQYMPTVEIVNGYKREQQLYAYMQEYSKAPYIYPLLEEMTAANYYQVYYKYDSHWNHLGGLYGANALYQAMGIEQTEPAAWITGTADADKYELYTYMGIPDDKVTHDDLEYIVDYRPEVTVAGMEDPEAMIVHTESDGANNKRLCLIGDSFRVNMDPYLAKDFTNCTFVHRDYMSEVKPDIINSDVIVIEAVERYDYEAFNTVQRVINILK
ncbi:MAG: hypothetical protein K5773_07565 [Pseudobutyrivibrio sp.]|nr:hypothetical protein [Pseudobutyrivibrio sp.]